MFKQRFLSTIVLLAIFAGVIFTPPIISYIVFVPVAVFLAYFAEYEMVSMLEFSGRKVWKKTSSAISAIAMFLALIMNVYRPASTLFALFLIAFFAGPWIAFLFSKNQKDYMERLSNLIWTNFMFIIPFVFISNIYMMEGPYGLLFFIIGTKIGDIGAYVTGMLSNKFLKGGNHKMIPSISPGKSWEGAAGGLIFSILWSVFLYGPLVDCCEPVWLKILLGALLFVFGAAGDLAESSIKRICGVKDSGKTIPGIGGVFDLVDSLMLNSIVFTVFITIFK